ncbi:MAG: hypothetical protein A2286_05870 [Gammaproteobacteria bacterium RIFOXYA12_FULL_61_12]|nr:MAG: hypothetical protein A2514_04335 [Gammaproteobacteria bacterium RIFOXYD12_FULL_61_37]OGT94536.1 MAG: hypothetical protein A2286_05870 [Gammaproteobacteria bacterium RIFOXYA12_FULL_61_12]
MHSIALDKQLGALKEWKEHLARTILEYHTWLRTHKMLSAEAEERIRYGLSALKKDELTIAFVAEFSRGKTELINAIFFADYGRRLLPSSAGRTTMCPVEMFYDHAKGEAYLKTLPIETRQYQRSLSSYKNEPDAWVHFPLDINSPDQLEQTLKEVKRTKKVSIEEAHRLGLSAHDMAMSDEGSNAAYIEIPKWRHALLSFPHPLMKKGLRVLDTPGLNALGSEPELTLSMLPAAQAILFVLAADTGVTRSDLEMWQHHIQGFQRGRHRGILVALNKIDTLWDDELQTEAAINSTIARQRSSTAKLLDIPEGTVFPVSAQKALVAKIKRDAALMKRSALLEIEDYLSEDILSTRQQILAEVLSNSLGDMLSNSVSLVSEKLGSVQKQRTELLELTDKSDAMIEHMLSETSDEKVKYKQNVGSFLSSQKTLQGQAEDLRRALSIESLDKMINEAHGLMQGNWTTAGLKKSMRSLFDQLNTRMEEVTAQVEETRRLVRSIYRRFQDDHGFNIIQPRMFSVMKYRVQLEMLHQEAEIFRNSTLMALTEKHFVIKRFFNAIVDQARRVFADAAKEANGWTIASLEPLKYQIRDHKDLLDRKITDLKKIAQSRSTLNSRVEELDNHREAVEVELEKLKRMQGRLFKSVSAEAPSAERPRPRLVASN